MWGPYPPVELQPDDGYYCEACDIYGVGEFCWMCTSTDVDRKKLHPNAALGHRNNPSVRQVAAPYTSGGVIEVDPIDTL